MTPRLKFILLAILFTLPLAAAWLVYFGMPSLKPAGRLNYGELLDPPRPALVLDLRDGQGAPAGVAVLKGKWTLVHLSGENCFEACRQRLLLTRQLRLALNEKRLRLRRLYIAPTPEALASTQAALAAEHADLVLVVDAGAPGVRAADFFQFGQAADPHAVYLLDPLGHWIMIYPYMPSAEGPQREFKGMQKDLKKLMKLTRIG